MAAVIDNKTQQELAAQQAQQTAQATQTNAAANPASVGNNAPQYTTPLKGVSENTANKLGQYSQGYQQSAGVQAAQNYLNGVLNKKPVADANLSQLYDRIMNREQFNYDLNGDALYQQYKDQYQNMGKQAMMDTMGNATALTGGYGSSYASTAGNQAYQQYLRQLNDIVPELYQMAYDRYTQEGNDLMNQYNLAYGQHRDAVGDWENERNYANTNYQNERDMDYANYQNMLNFWNQMAQQENEAYYTDKSFANADREYALAERDFSYNLAMAIIAKKQMPSAELLAAAGITEDDAIKLGAKKPSSGSSSKKKSSGGSTPPPKENENVAQPDPLAGSLAWTMLNASEVAKEINPVTTPEKKSWLSNLLKK